MILSIIWPVSHFGIKLFIKSHDAMRKTTELRFIAPRVNRDRVCNATSYMGLAKDRPLLTQEKIFPFLVQLACDVIAYFFNIRGDEFKEH